MKAVIILSLLALALPAASGAAAEQSPEEMRREIEAEYARLRAEAAEQQALDAQASARHAALAAKIAPHAFTEYSIAGHPKTYAIWGIGGVRRISQHERQAANVVAAQPECDRVDYVGLSNRSIPTYRIVVFVDCANRERYHVGPGEIASGKPRRPHEALAE